MGFCLSLSEQTLPAPSDYPEEEREFNRYTLLGEYDIFFVALLKERYREHKGKEALEDLFRAHVNRGILLLQLRLRSLDQLGDLIYRLQAKGCAFLNSELRD